ncbi:MAG: hypothetical protein EBR52_09495, partial [Microbacteriaceae bacterium]|nr:hypothetical protein [Microbacteriaceae bacterium]
MADDSLPLVGRRADLVTYYEARAFLDRRFSQFRYQAVNQLNPDEPTHAAVALRVIDKQWASAARALRLMLLPQRRRRKKLYRPVATRNPVLRSGPKVRVRRSIAWRRK